MSDYDFTMAIAKARNALDAAEHLPHGPYHRFARDDLRAAISWLQQAHDEWAQRKAGQ